MENNLRTSDKSPKDWVKCHQITMWNCQIFLNWIIIVLKISISRSRLLMIILKLVLIDSFGYRRRWIQRSHFLKRKRKYITVDIRLIWIRFIRKIWHFRKRNKNLLRNRKKSLRDRLMLYFRALRRILKQNMKKLRKNLP